MCSGLTQEDTVQEAFKKRALNMFLFLREDHAGHEIAIF